MCVLQVQCKRDAVDAAVREIAQDREAFAGARTEALTRIGKAVQHSDG